MVNFRPAAIFFSFFMPLAIVYSPVLYFNYTFHDDTFFWFMSDEHGQHYFFRDVFYRARYGTWALQNIEALFIHHVSDLKFLRLLGILALSATACLCFQQMLRLSWHGLHAFLATLAIFLLPGAHDFVFWAIASVLSLSAFFACLAFVKIQKEKHLLGPVCLLLLAISIYQTWAMFFWVMVGTFVLFSDISQPAFKKPFTRCMAAGITSIVIYAIIILGMKCFYTHFNPDAMLDLGPYNPYKITSHWFEKIQWFFGEPMLNALNLWNIFPNTLVAIMVSGFIAMTVLRVGLTSPKQLKKIGIIIVLIFLAFLPNLVSAANEPSYRCLFPLSSLIWILVLWAGKQWIGPLPANASKWTMTILLSLAVLHGGIKAFHDVLYYRVLPSYIEWNAFRSMAAAVPFKDTDMLLINLPSHIPGIERYDEYGVLSIHYLNDVYLLLFAALHETNPRPVMPLLTLKFPKIRTVYAFNQFCFRTLPNGKVIYKEMNKPQNYRLMSPSKVAREVGWRNTINTYTIDKDTALPSGLFILDLRNLFSKKNYADIINGVLIR